MLQLRRQPLQQSGYMCANHDSVRLLAVVFMVLMMALPQAAHATSFAGYARSLGDNLNVFLDILNYVSYIGGALAVTLGISDLRKHVENPQTPLKNGLTKLGFGGFMLALPSLWAVFAETFFASDGSSFDLATVNAFVYGTLSTQGLAQLMVNALTNVTILIGAANFASYLIGAWFILRGIQMLRSHIENPQTPLAEGLKRLAVGGAMLSLPMLIMIVRNTFGNMSAAPLANSGWNGGTASGGLDGMVTNLVSNIARPAYFGIEIFCYIAGALLILFAMQRLVRTAQDQQRGPLGFGTITTFLVAGILLSLPQFLGTINTTIFGAAGALTKIDLLSLASAGVDTAQREAATRVLSAIFAFMAIIGFLSVVRGLFILKAFADGNGQATMMSVVTHIVAGALAINLGAFVNAIQQSLGLSSLAVQFS